jgi:hypothetical protein
MILAQKNRPAPVFGAEAFGFPPENRRRVFAPSGRFSAPLPPGMNPASLEGGRREGGSGGEGQRGKPNRRAVFVPDHGDADGRAARAARYHAPQGAAKPPPRTRAGGTAAARSPWRPFGVADAAGCRRTEVRVTRRSALARRRPARSGAGRRRREARLYPGEITRLAPSGVK